jgi:phage tail sheath protein FI
MPVRPTYPGVYIEEIPSGVRTITGVATSITAFVGRAQRGPVDDPTTINGYADFERRFGGLWEQSRLAYAVRDFFLNGGSQAIIVRLFRPQFSDDTEQKKAEDAAKAVAAATTGADAQTAATAARTKANEYNQEPEKSAAAIVAKAAEDAASAPGSSPESVKKAADDAVSKAAPKVYTTLDVAGLTLRAAYPGSWGQKLRVTVDVNVSQSAADQMGLTKTDLFNLTARDTIPGGRVEQFYNLTVKDTVRRIDRVLEGECTLLRYRGSVPTDLPQAIKDAHSASEETKKKLDDEVTATESKLSKKLMSDPNADVTTERAAVEAAKAKLDTSDGEQIDKDSFIGTGMEGQKKGLYALEKADLFNILCLPPYATDQKDVDPALVANATAYCEKRRAMLLVDSPSTWTDKDSAKQKIGQVGTNSKNAALFFPRLKQPDPLHEDRLDMFVPCGAVAGVFARTDTARGVWKAPAGLEATLQGVPELSVPLTDAENGELNPLGINCLRSMPPAGRIVWGSRTLQGDDRLASEWKYIPVRRTALFIEESLYRATQWVVFEPNDEPLWAQIRLNVGAFMHNLFRQGAFQGSTPREAYFVKCDKETTTQNDINLGIVNIVVGFAPLKPAEFVIIKIQQIAGQIEA